MANIEISTLTRNNDGNTYIIKDANAFPKRGGKLSGTQIQRSQNYDHLEITGGTDYNSGPSLVLTPYGSTEGWQPQGSFALHTNNYDFIGYSNGSLMWRGQPIQYGSDQRLKQQISEIDDKLLDAWEDVTLCQFKYNDAVEEKGKDNARLHTGYVVQQINEACQKHNIDISEYGLYCHEEYPERTEEVTIENEDGTTKKETKVIEEASEHYSLRYTETLVVECAYLRRENNKLKQQFKQLEKTVNELKSIINCSENPNS